MMELYVQDLASERSELYLLTPVI